MQNVINLPCKPNIDIKACLKLVKDCHCIMHVLFIIELRILSYILKEQQQQKKHNLKYNAINI